MDIKKLQADIKSWADSVFPNRTVKGAFDKMVFEEIPELYQGQFKDPLEFADVAILLFDVADLMGIDMEAAIKKKMAINRDRDWEFDEETGFMRHVKKDKMVSRRKIRVKFELTESNLLFEDDVRQNLIKYNVRCISTNPSRESKSYAMIINEGERVEDYFPHAFKVESLGVVNEIE